VDARADEEDDARRDIGADTVACVRSTDTAVIFRRTMRRPYERKRTPPRAIERRAPLLPRRRSGCCAKREDVSPEQEQPPQAGLCTPASWPHAEGPRGLRWQAFVGRRPLMLRGRPRLLFASAEASARHPGWRPWRADASNLRARQLEHNDRRELTGDEQARGRAGYLEALQRGNRIRAHANANS